jgi:hypothetical protein
MWQKKAAAGFDYKAWREGHPQADVDAHDATVKRTRLRSQGHCRAPMLLQCVEHSKLPVGEKF